MPRRLAAASVLLALTSSACAAQQGEQRPTASCIVGRIADGDTFRCADGRRVRLIGIDSPETQQQPFGVQAKDALQKLLPAGEAVRLESDAGPRDRYGRLLAYVWIGPTLVNEVMIREGWAVLYTVPPNVKYADRFTRAQNEARARRAGLWSERGFDCLPNDYRQRRCVSPP
jgi:micrococcal nuclease